MPVFIPTIDFSAYDEQDEASLEDLGKLVSDALIRSGFMKIVNLGICQAQIDRTFELSRWFFARTEKEKSASAYLSAEENFGYQSLGIEHLDPARPADLKQTLRFVICFDMTGQTRGGLRRNSGTS